MIHYTAPSVCGIKPANMFSVTASLFGEKEFAVWKNLLLKHGLSCFFYRLSKDRVLILVYNELWVEKLLRTFEIEKYLEGKGYLLDAGLLGRFSFSRTSLVLYQLKERIGKSFPHEIGIILGYPLVDVIAFEKSCGKNCKYCGVWKCYSDEQKARQCENKFRECSLLCSKWFDQGYSLGQIVQNYKNVRYL